MPIIEPPFLCSNILFYLLWFSVCRTEKNATGWSKDKIKELLTGFVIEDSDGKAIHYKTSLGDEQHFFYCKNLEINNTFSTLAQNIDCEYTLETCTHNLCFG